MPTLSPGQTRDKVLSRRDKVPLTTCFYGDKGYLGGLSPLFYSQNLYSVTGRPLPDDRGSCSTNTPRSINAAMTYVKFRWSLAWLHSSDNSDLGIKPCRRYLTQLIRRLSLLLATMPGKMLSGAERLSLQNSIIRRDSSP